MADEMSVGEFLAHPVATITAAVAVVGGWLPTGFLEPILGTLWAQSGSLLAVFSVSATQLAGRIPWVSRRTLEILAVVFAVLFVANRLWKVYSGYTSRTEDNS